MASKTPRPTIVAFKAEAELVELLNRLPNKSEFIRRAIQAQLGLPCPVCHGDGSVTRELFDRLVSLMENWTLHQCHGCGAEFTLPKRTDGIPAEALPHWTAVARRGVAQCPSCFHDDELGASAEFSLGDYRDDDV